MEIYKRISKDLFFMSLAYLTSNRSTCYRRNIGSVLTKEGYIISTGYNGSARKSINCLSKENCVRDILKIESGTNLNICMAVHSEVNCITTASRLGINTDGTILYCTHFPCSTCLNILINAGVKEIVYSEDYPDDFSKYIYEERLKDIIKIRRFCMDVKLEFTIEEEENDKIDGRK